MSFGIPSRASDAGPTTKRQRLSYSDWLDEIKDALHDAERCHDSLATQRAIRRAAVNRIADCAAEALEVLP